MLNTTLSYSEHEQPSISCPPHGCGSIQKYQLSFEQISLKILKLGENAHEDFSVLGSRCHMPGNIPLGKFLGKNLVWTKAEFLQKENVYNTKFNFQSIIP
jgi:hypothetical protein